MQQTGFYDINPFYKITFWQSSHCGCNTIGIAYWTTFIACIIYYIWL